ncbi:MAG: PAS domain-containing protein [Desulfobacteraceae bacterium]|nr:PAS domain-containing protein [Desulfobacteraceae bacterium]
MIPKKSGISLQNLSIQFSLIVIGIPTIVLIIFGMLRIHTQTRAHEKNMDIFLKNEASQLSASLSTALFNFDDETCTVICKAALRKPEIVKITIFDLNEKYLIFEDADYDPDDTYNNRAAQLPIFFKTEDIGEVEIVVTHVLLKEKIRILKWSSLLQVVVLDLILGVALIILLLIRFVRPLQDLQQDSEKIASGKLDQPISVHRDDEIGALADNLISMRDAVKEKVQSLESEISKHRETALALEKSESFLRLIIDLIPHMIFVKDLEGRFLVVNKAVADDLNTTVEDLTGKRQVEVFKDKEEARQTLEDDRRVIQTGHTLTLLTETHGTARELPRWYSTKKVPFTAADGDKGLVDITIDVSDLKQTEEELKKAKNYIDNIINSMPSVLISVDLEFKINLWNKEAETLFIKTASEAYKKPLVDVIPQMSSMMTHIKKAIDAGEPCFMPKQSIQTSDGLKYEDITIYPIVADVVEGVVIRVDDITEHVRMEQMIVQSEKMLSVGGLAAGMAHEINNPLAGMMQNAQVVLRRVQKDMPASTKAAEEAGVSMESIRVFLEKRGIIQQLERIHEAGVRASKIVANMLSFSRKDYSGKIPQDIAVILDQTVELARSDYDLKKQYDFKKIKIIREYEEDMPQIPCEATKIQQVFFNIMKNAAEAMQQDNFSKNPIFLLRVKKKENIACIEIEDNGPGMDDETRKRAFEPFFTTKPVGQGTGLGLSVSYFIVTDNHGGKMNVISEPGKGATFIIHLPIS